MARPSNRDARRAQLADALMRAISKHGYSQTTTALIAAEASVSPSLVHYHFSSKDEVLRALVDRLAAGLRRRYLDALDRRDADDPMGRIEAFIWAHVGDGGEQGRDADASAAWVIVSTEAARADAAEVRALIQALTDEALGHLSALLLDAASPGSCEVAPSDDPMTPWPALPAQAQTARGAEARAHAAGVLALFQGAFQLDAAAPGLAPAGFASAAARRLAHAAVEALR